MSKPFLTYEQQIHKLEQDKKLLIPDHANALQLLKNLGYFSLIGGYKAPFVNPMTRIYEMNTSIDDIFSLYKYDQVLRELFFRHLCDIEKHLRQLISYTFCLVHGEDQTAYLNPANYNTINKNVSEVNRLVSTLSYYANNNADHAYLLHQRKRYRNVPLWVLINALTFGQISKMYTLLPFSLQSDISKEFSTLNERILDQYLKIFTLFRNVCAHNERLFSFRTQIDFPDMPLHKMLFIPQKGTQYIQGKRDLFGLVIAFYYMLPWQDFMLFANHLKNAIADYLNQSCRISKISLLKMMGFPDNWETMMQLNTPG
jgi:abortive infection bacteriophage resistance protein